MKPDIFDGGRLSTRVREPYSPDDAWLASVGEEEQIEAMRRWFLDRYENPANETPWDGEDKSYVYVWGGPYDPNDVIQERFGHVVEIEAMSALIQELWRDVGDEWAPIQHEGVEYEDYVAHLTVDGRYDPLHFLNDRVDEIFSVLEAAGIDGGRRVLLHQMAHSSMIAAFEAYLADTVRYWIDNDDHVLRRLVTTNRDFQARTFSLSDVFERHAKIKEEVKAYLGELVWHRLDKIKPILISSLEIIVPDIGDLMKEVLIRHDIVHRAGRRADGSVVALAEIDLKRLRRSISVFVNEIEAQLGKRFPDAF